MLYFEIDVERAAQPVSPARSTVRNLHPFLGLKTGFSGPTESTNQYFGLFPPRLVLYLGCKPFCMNRNHSFVLGSKALSRREVRKTMRNTPVGERSHMRGAAACVHAHALMPQ